MHPEIERARVDASADMQDALMIMERHIETYVQDYEWRADEGDHTPTEDERALIADAIHGLLADHDFMDSLRRYFEQREFLKGSLNI